MTAGTLQAVVESMGRRGDGLVVDGGDRIHVPYALPGEQIAVHRDGSDQGTLLGVLEPSAERIAPFCPYFGSCGGCAIQHWAPLPYSQWKQQLLRDALARAGVAADVAPLEDAHGAGRRRATFHARFGGDGRQRVGFTEARSHAIVAIETCPILEPRMSGALPAARALASALAPAGKPLDILVTATEGGLDIDLRGHGPLQETEQARLVEVAARHGLARLSNHGAIVLERQKAVLEIGSARVELPAGAFLQPTDAGERALASHVLAAMAGGSRLADLFSGCGTLALRLAERAQVHAVDFDRAALAALDRASRAARALRPLTTEARDLHRRPLTVEELAAFDAVCLDPPRAGAEAQMCAIAASRIETVVSVACDVGTFSRDAAILIAAGFKVGTVMPIDQFRYTPHVEVVAAFTRAPPKRKRRLLG